MILFKNILVCFGCMLSHSSCPSWWFTTYDAQYRMLPLLYTSTAGMVGSICAIGSYNLGYDYTNCVLLEGMWTSIFTIRYAGALAESQHANVELSNGKGSNNRQDEMLLKQIQMLIKSEKNFSNKLKSSGIEYKLVRFSIAYDKSTTANSSSATGPTREPTYWYNTVVNDEVISVRHQVHTVNEVAIYARFSNGEDAFDALQNLLAKLPGITFSQG